MHHSFLAKKLRQGDGLVDGDETSKARKETFFPCLSGPGIPRILSDTLVCTQHVYYYFNELLPKKFETSAGLADYYTLTQSRTPTR